MRRSEGVERGATTFVDRPSAEFTEDHGSRGLGQGLGAGSRKTGGLTSTLLKPGTPALASQTPSGSETRVTAVHRARIEPVTSSRTGGSSGCRHPSKG